MTLPNSYSQDEEERAYWKNIENMGLSELIANGICRVGV